MADSEAREADNGWAGGIRSCGGIEYDLRRTIAGAIPSDESYGDGYSGGLRNKLTAVLSLALMRQLEIEVSKAVVRSGVTQPGDRTEGLDVG